MVGERYTRRKRWRGLRREVSQGFLERIISVSQQEVEQMSAVETDLWVFRDGRKSVSGTSLLHELQRGLKKLLDSPRPRIREATLP